MIGDGSIAVRTRVAVQQDELMSRLVVDVVTKRTFMLNQ
jgi:hypothetical protein